MVERTGLFPDGTVIDKWFSDDKSDDKASVKTYCLTDYGIYPDGEKQTEKIQGLIDRIAAEGEGTIVVPEGVFLTGALFFKKGVHLFISENGVLKGSDDISDYPLMQTRIEGESCPYFSALINADNADGFTVYGDGVIDGNGLKAWKSFWLRLKWHPDATNKDEQRPRLVYISDSKNVTIKGVTLKDSPFWTCHIYKCNKVRITGCKFLAPKAPVPAPSSDAIDIDACSDVLIEKCFISVNDDGVVLKGGKGLHADTLPENGKNERIIIQGCKFGFCHSCLTLGSETVEDKNVIFTDSEVDGAWCVFRIKMREDTPQKIENIEIKNISGKADLFVDIMSWSQFHSLKDGEEVPPSYVKRLFLKGCKIECDKVMRFIKPKKKHKISDFVFEDIDVVAKENGLDESSIDNLTIKNVNVKQKG